MRSLIDGGGGGASGGGSGPPDLDRLRNLSVSSADFNFGGDGGSASLPGTPSFRPQFFHIPGKGVFFSVNTVNRETSSLQVHFSPK